MMTELRNKNRGYMKLVVWEKATDLFQIVFDLAYNHAAIDFKLRSQFADAAQSISANIAEGYGRRSLNEYIQFLYYALGSAAETLTRAIGLRRVSLISAEQFDAFDKLHYEVENRLLRLVERLEAKRDTGEWTSRIAEDEPDYEWGEIGNTITPLLHHSITPSPR